MSEYIAPPPFTKEQAEEFFSEVFCGKHHIPGDLREFGNGWKINAYGGWLSTFDFDTLTRLVLLAHDRCVRVEMVQGGPGRVGIAIWQRRTREGDIATRHPTMEQALAACVYRAPGVIACSFTDGVGHSPNGRHHWEFSKMFGPTFTTKDGRILEKQPSVHSAAWRAFEDWYRAMRASDSGRDEHG